MSSLNNYLASLNVAELKSRLNLISGTPKLTRKDEFISFLHDELLSDHLEDYWLRLCKIEQMAIAETIYHWDGTFNPNRFMAKYEKLPRYFLSAGNSLKQRSLLALFFYRDSMPQDLADRCRNYVKAPASYQLTHRTNDQVINFIKTRQQEIEKQQDEYHPKSAILSMENHAIHDLQAVLDLVGEGKITISEKTKIAGAATIKKITAILLDGDYYSEQDDWDLEKYQGGAIAAIRAYAWPLLLQSTSVGLVRRVGTKLELTAKGKRVSQSSIEETIRLLYQRWRDKGMIDEFNRINIIKGQTGKGQRLLPVITRRITIEHALKKCPENEWISVDDFFRYLQAECFDIRVIFDHWKLYISDSRYGCLAYSSCSFEVIQGRYILAYLFEYLATLGMIDVAYLPPYYARDDFEHMECTEELSFFSRYDGLLFFRINPLGSYCLDRRDDYQPPKKNVLPLLDVSDGLNITLQRKATPSEKKILEQYLHVKTETHYRLEQVSLLKAIEQGGELSIFATFLNTMSEQALSPEIQDILLVLEERCNALTDRGNARLLNCSSTALANMLATDPNTGKFCFLSGDKILVIPEKSDKAFQKAVKKLGYIIPKKSL